MRKEPLPGSPVRPPIFFDQRGWRKYAVTSFNWGATGLGAILLTSLLLAVLINPTVPAFRGFASERSISPAQAILSEPFAEPHFDRAHARSATLATALATKRYGHFVLWDENSFSSLKRHGAELDALIGEWLVIAGPEAVLQRASVEKEELVRKWASKHAPDMKIYPSLSNYSTKLQQWDNAIATTLLSSPERRAELIRQIVAYLVTENYPGLVLDFEQMSVNNRNDFTEFVNALSGRLRSFDKTLIVQMTVADPVYDTRALAQAAEAVIVAIYDEHTEDGTAGPLAGQGWFEQQVQLASATIPANKLVIGIGSYAYTWPQKGKGHELSVQEALELLAESGSSLRFDPQSLNPTFGYRNEGDEGPSSVWMLDGVTAYNQIAASLAVRPAGLALWRLGTEDQGVWASFGRGRLPDVAARKDLETVHPGYDVLYKGQGEVLEVRDDTKSGKRALTYDDKSRLIVDQAVVDHPRSTIVNRRKAQGDKVIALTFDDGPDPKYTDRILDVLAQKDVKATFFVVGTAAVVNQSIIQRIYREGHDIGNHTFTHANAFETSTEHIRLELNATQRLIEATLGVRTRLFRPPFAKDLEPQTIDSAEVMRTAGSLGYWTIGMGIDPKDWQVPIVRRIVDKTIAGARRGDGNIVLLHDAGGPRDATIKALPEIIDSLRAEGYRFVPVHELLGLKREQVMPPTAVESSFVANVNLLGFSAISAFNWSAWLIFYLSVFLGVVRLLFIGSLAIWHRRRERSRANLEWTPASVTAIVPAFNEGPVIIKTLRSLFASTYPNLKVIVVDDGSTDGTGDLVRKAFSDNRRLTVISKPNGGKWSALNTGLGATQDDIVVMLDADTIFAPDAVSLLVRHFADPKVGAVCGHAVVGNRINLLTRFQALEYATNQNLDRRALEVVNGITVVPGAIGAWRREALEKIGGYASDTLAEDADATVRLVVAGWKVVCEPSAVARTESPETVRQFLKQRLRWMFGTLQVACKNIGVVKRGRPLGLALFGLPNILVFQFLFTLMAPIVDLMMIWSLISAFMTMPLESMQGMRPALETVFLYWIAFQSVEITTALLAVSIDRRDGIWRLAPLLLVQKFIYRQLLYITAVRVALAALKGTMQGWGKLHRTGNVTVIAPAPGAQRVAA